MHGYVKAQCECSHYYYTVTNSFSGVSLFSHTLRNSLSGVPSSVTYFDKLSWWCAPPLSHTLTNSLSGVPLFSHIARQTVLVVCTSSLTYFDKQP